MPGPPPGTRQLASAQLTADSSPVLGKIMDVLSVGCWVLVVALGVGGPRLYDGHVLALGTLQPGP